MIRQLPRLTLPSFMTTSDGGVEQAAHGTDVKVYDVITESTLNNTAGNTMQLQLFQRDSEVNEGARELHGKLILNTTNLPDKQDLRFGFMFAEDLETGLYDGLQVKAKVNQKAKNHKFVPMDIVSSSKPSIFSENFELDQYGDWVIREEESSISCEGQGKCQISVVFVRSFETSDEA